MIDYKKRLVEVDEILNHLVEEELSKIPEDVRKAIKDNKDKNYIWHYDETKELKNQNLERDTIIILSYINMEYLLTQEQKELVEKMHAFNEMKKRNTNYEKNKEKQVLKVEKKITNKELTVRSEKSNFFKSLLNKIRNIFK